MKMNTSRSLCLLSYALLPFAVQAQVSFQTELNTLVNRDALATHPNGTYTQHQVSSHDPRNAQGKSPLGAPWGMFNVDFGNYLRSEDNGNGRIEHVVLEDTGPGVFTRWWATAINEGTGSNRYRIYLDGELVIEDTMIRLLGGDNNGFGNELNFHTPLRMGNLYLPLPYAESIKITWDGPLTHRGKVNIAAPGAGFSVANATWYNINYKKLAPSTKVQTFSKADLQKYASELKATNAMLATPSVTGHVDQKHVASDEVISNGQALRHSISGSGAIRRLKVNISGADQVAALRDTYIELVFDGIRTARVPAAHFFGSGESKDTSTPYNIFQDYIRKVEANGDMTCYWVMPFQESGEVRIVNESGQDVSVHLEVDSGSWQWGPHSMYFYSDFLVENNIRTHNKRLNYSTYGDADWRMLTVRGRGILVGDTLSIRNFRTGGPNNWWGEGDEKVYVDYIDAKGNGSASTPVHVGTGTEDYYGYSFGARAGIFDSPFVAQPIAEGNSSTTGQLTVNSRVRGLDAVPFNNSFKLDMEVWKWQQGYLDYDAAIHWYGVPGATSLIPAADLAADFVEASAGQNSRQAGVVDTAGDGQWQYLSSDRPNPSASNAQLKALTWGSVGDAGNNGYGGGQNGANLAAISKQFINSNGGENLGINDAPGYHEVAVAPAGAIQSYAVARWVAGDSSTGLINIYGSVRNFIENGDSIDFAIYVNGVQRFVANGSGSTLDETYFDFDSTIKNRADR